MSVCYTFYRPCDMKKIDSGNYAGGVAILTDY